MCPSTFFKGTEAKCEPKGEEGEEIAPSFIPVDVRGACCPSPEEKTRKDSAAATGKKKAPPSVVIIKSLSGCRSGGKEKFFKAFEIWWGGQKGKGGGTRGLVIEKRRGKGNFSPSGE